MFATSAARANPVLEPSARAAVARYRQTEAAFKLIDGHASRVVIHGEARGRPVKTRRSTLIISGLFNSPPAMSALEDEFLSRGENVINLRLAGHFEVDVSSMRGGVRWQMWLEQARQAFELAQILGDRVTLVGHSTGAALVTWLALENPDRVAGLALFAPAFDLNVRLKQILALPTEIPERLPLPRVVTLHAGREVERLGVAFRERLVAADQPGFAAARAPLDKIPTWMANSECDTVIDLPTARAFYAAIEDASAARAHVRLRRCELILHDQLASPGGKINWWRRNRFAFLTRSLGHTLYGE